MCVGLCLPRTVKIVSKPPKRAGSPEDILVHCFPVFIPAFAGVWAPSEQQVRPFASGEPSGVGGPRHRPSPSRKAWNFYCRGRALITTHFCVCLLSWNWFQQKASACGNFPFCHFLVSHFLLPHLSSSLKHLIHPLTWSKISNMLLSVCLLLLWTGKSMLSNAILTL